MLKYFEPGRKSRSMCCAPVIFSGSISISLFTSWRNAARSASRSSSEGSWPAGTSVTLPAMPELSKRAPRPRPRPQLESALLAARNAAKKCRVTISHRQLWLAADEAVKVYITRTFLSYTPAYPARGDTRTCAARERERPLKRPVLGPRRLGSRCSHPRPLLRGPRLLAHRRTTHRR